MDRKSCSIEGCVRRPFGHGWCQKHYARWRRHGDPLATPRFDVWGKIDQRGPDECWPWTKGADLDGYGITKVNGRKWRVARWVLTQKLGRDLDPLEVTRHSCDNPPCCNPAHLDVGLARDNSADAVERGRLITGDAHWARQDPQRQAGARNPAARLTEDQVRTIRTRYAAGETQVALAVAFGVSQPLISQIIRRAAWAHLE